MGNTSDSCYYVGQSSIATLPTADRLTFDQIKTLLESDEDRMVAERARKQQILEEFQTAPLETIMNRANSRVSEPSCVCRADSLLVLIYCMTAVSE